MAERKAPIDETEDSLEKKKAAYEALKSGNYENARSLFVQLSQSYPWVAAFRFNVALTEFKQGRLQDALINLNAGLAIEPGDEKAKKLKRLIETRSKEAQHDAMPSDARVTRAVAERNREDEHMTSRILGGQCGFSHIIKSEGAADAPPSAKGQPGYSSSRLMNFVVFEKQRRRQETRSVRENDIDDEPHATRLSWYFSKGKMDGINKPIPNAAVFIPRPNLTTEFMDNLMTRIELLPRNDDTVFMDSMKSRYSYEIGYIKETINELHKQKQYKQTVKACEKFLEHFPDDLEILFELGNFHMETGNIGQSEATFKNILEIYYDNAYAWHKLARVYEIKGLWQFEAFCLQKAKAFGYSVDEIRLARFMLKGIPVDPFTDNVHWE